MTSVNRLRKNAYRIDRLLKARSVTARILLILGKTRGQRPHLQCFDFSFVPILLSLGTHSCPHDPGRATGSGKIWRAFIEAMAADVVSVARKRTLILGRPEN